MKKTKILVLCFALLILGVAYVAGATQKTSSNPTKAKAACCAMACCQQGSCCASDACDMKKDGHAAKTEGDAKACPMKTKAAAQGESCHAEGASCGGANCCAGDKKQTAKKTA